MKTKNIIIKKQHGIHFREAGKIVELSNSVNSTIILQNKKVSANANSILELFLLDAEEASELSVIVDGEDEDIVLMEVVKILGQSD